MRRPRGPGGRFLTASELAAQRGEAAQADVSMLDAPVQDMGSMPMPMLGVEAPMSTEATVAPAALLAPPPPTQPVTHASPQQLQHQPTHAHAGRHAHAHPHPHPPAHQHAAPPAGDAFAGFPLVPPSTHGGFRAHAEHVQNIAMRGAVTTARGTHVPAGAYSLQAFEMHHVPHPHAHARHHSRFFGE
jgi:nuclear transcription factor Y alpha